MNTYIISYDLRQPGRNYSGLIQAIQRYTIWGKLTESCWCIKSLESAVQVRDNLLKYIDLNDRILVVQTAHVAAWSNLLAPNEWVRSNI